jgi:hypothetical protein
VFLFPSEAVKFTSAHALSMIQKPSSIGIAELEPRHRALQVVSAAAVVAGGHRRSIPVLPLNDEARTA